MLQQTVAQPFLIACTLAGLILADCSVKASEVTGLPSTKLECFLVPNARIVLPTADSSSELKSLQSTMNAANYGHEITDGTSYVFALRKYEDDGTGPDAGVFTKLTLTFKSADVHLSDGQTKPYDVSSGFYVQGSTGFVGKREYWQAKNAVPQISMTKGLEGLTASVHASFIAAHAAPSEKKEVVLDLKCPVRTASVKELGPWEGKVGTDWESFAPAQ